MFGSESARLELIAEATGFSASGIRFKYLYLISRYGRSPLLLVSLCLSKLATAVSSKPVHIPRNVCSNIWNIKLCTQAHVNVVMKGQNSEMCRSADPMLQVKEQVLCFLLVDLTKPHFFLRPIALTLIG